MASIKLSPSEVVAVGTKTIKRSAPTDSPWQSIDHDPLVIIGGVDGGYGDDGTEVRYTNVCEMADNDHAPANAALIIAAPDLLAAVKAYMFTEQTAGGLNPHKVGTNKHRAFELGRAAIAKAESR